MIGLVHCEFLLTLLNPSRAQNCSDARYLYTCHVQLRQFLFTCQTRSLDWLH